MEDPAQRSAEDSTGGSPAGSRQETDYRRIVDNVPGCVLLADAKGQIVYANRVSGVRTMAKC
jgi:PAS domain-containing protein